MMSDELLIEWCMKRYDVSRDIAYDCIEFGPGWWVLKAMLESIIYERTNGQKPENRNYFPSFPGFEKIGLNYQQSTELNHLLMKLSPVLVKAVRGDQEAKIQIEAIRKVADRRSYKISLSDIRKFIDVNGADASRARAFQIIIRMGLIAPFVTPKWTDSTSILEGTVELLPPFLVKGGMIPESYAKVQTLFKKNSTLKSLAVSYYQAELARMGFRFTLRQLSNDLEEFKDWKPESDEPSWPVSINTFTKQGDLLNQESMLTGISSQDWMKSWVTRKARTKKPGAEKLGTRKKK